MKQVISFVSKHLIMTQRNPKAPLMMIYPMHFIPFRSDNQNIYNFRVLEVSAQFMATKVLPSSLAFIWGASVSSQEDQLLIDMQFV